MINFSFFKPTQRPGWCSRPGFDRIAEMREAVAFSPKWKMPGRVPYAAPFDCLNRNATQVAPYWTWPERDGPRRLVEPDGVPYWRSLGSPIHQPIENRHQAFGKQTLLRHLGIQLLQLSVDALVAISAILLSVRILLMGDRHRAERVLQDHLLNIVVLPVLLSCAVGTYFGYRTS